jgi:hypothetical protein
LDVKADVLVGDWGAIMVCCAEVHAWSVVVFIVNNVHLVATEVFLVLFLQLSLPSLQHNDVIVSSLLLYDFFCNFLNFLLLLQCFIESPAGEVVLE